MDPKARIFWKKYFFREIKSNIKESSPPSLHVSSNQVKHQPLDTKVSWKNFINAVLEEFRVIIKENHLPNDILSAFKDQKPKAEQLLHKLPDFPMRSELKVASKDALEEYAKRNEQAAKEVEFEKIRRNLFTKILMLKSILAEQRDLDREEVHIVRFGKICDTLGPWDFKYQNGLFVGILENVAALCGQKWFFSHVTKAAANESIADKEIGTFLVRFGNTRNSFVLTKIDRDKQNKKIIASFYVISDERGFSLFEQGPWFSTIMDLINNCIKEGFVTKPIDTTHSVVDQDKIFSGQLATVENYYLQPEITVRKSNDSKETLEGQLAQLKKRKEELTQRIGTEFNQEIFAELGALFLKMEEIEMQLNTKK